jgi:protein tyrosine phosphatase (PTP) superfamily phosphohydrolase (DUF442 family)
MGVTVVLRRFRRPRRAALRLVPVLATALIVAVVILRDDLWEKRVVVVEPGKLVRGAWQRPWPLRRIIAREHIRTIVSLTAINHDDPKYVSQSAVVRDTGVAWLFVPMRGSQATLAQMAEAADMLASPDNQPVFFHCVAGHHRTGLALAAYRIRHEGWLAEQAWHEAQSVAWARPDDAVADRRLIMAFAASPYAQKSLAKETGHAQATGSQMGRPVAFRHGDRNRAIRWGAILDVQLWHR